VYELVFLNMNVINVHGEKVKIIIATSLLTTNNHLITHLMV